MRACFDMDFESCGRKKTMILAKIVFGIFVGIVCFLAFLKRTAEKEE